MREFATAAEMATHVGEELGSSDWIEIDQARIDAFAQATGDLNWFHVDPERAAREMPGGRTIAHGLLTLSLVPGLGNGIYAIASRKRALNYGANKVRFLAPVPCGSRLRLRQRLLSVEPASGGMLITLENRMEIEGQERPAMIAETLLLVFE